MIAKLAHFAAARAADALAPVERAGLRALDERIAAPDAHGVLFVSAADHATALAVERHVARRARASGRPTLCADLAIADSCWCELATRLGISDLSSDPATAARQISAVAQRHVLTILGEIDRGTWDHEVQQLLVQAPGSVLCLIVNDREDTEPRLGDRDHAIFVDGRAQDDAAAWWSGVVQDAGERFTDQSVGALDTWWRWAAGQVGKLSSPSLASLSAEAVRALSRLHLVARAWPRSKLDLLASEQAWRELLDLQLVVDEQGFVRPEWDTAPGQAAPDDVRAAAQALDTAFADDPWARARAGRLHAGASDFERAEQSFAAAVAAVENASLRRQLWHGWLEALRTAPPAWRADASLRAAHNALERDDIDVALRLSQLAASGPDGPFESVYLTARAQLARGDVVAARVSFQRAMLAARNDAERAAVFAYQAEAAYVTGELDDAHTFASQALDRDPSDEIRLHARNTLGKILLARSDWDGADAHFAADEYDAACVGADMARVRARVNRAIALLSKGRAEPARAMLDGVLVEAEGRRDLRAMAFALSNLAVLALDRHDYTEALALSERAIDVRRRVGDRVGLARVITNLAELRLRLGLVQEAEQALAFGRQSLGAAMPPTRAAHFALVSARVHLARGETLDAARELAAAIADGGGSSDGAMLGECYRVAARIALEDGDVPRMARELALASSRTDSPFARAEVALLYALHAQARGDDAQEPLDAAHSLVRETGDEDLMREWHVLAADISRIEGDLTDARHHVEAAERLRDRVADSLPASLRAGYLARRELARIQNVRSAVERAELATGGCIVEPPPSSQRAAEHTPSIGFIGSHPSVQRLLSAVRKVARTRAPVLIRGESGTGKELVAEALHRLSDRRRGPLVKVNCAALVETLLLSELFGHEKGSFTGAAARRRGRFELADGGTLFLDEIGDISPRTQVALLRVLQDQTFERVGGSVTLHADVRIVCATNRDLKALVAQGTFREDLYYRLCGVTLEIPALRMRADDIADIADHLLQVVAAERKEPPKRLSEGALQVLQRHSWPGNVRELDNVLRAASLFCDSPEIDPATIVEHLHPAGESAPALDDPQCSGPASCPSLPQAGCTNAAGGDPSTVAYDEIRARGASLSDLKRQIEHDCIQRALQETGGNITRAASLLGMKRPRLSQLVKQYGLLESTSEEL